MFGLFKTDPKKKLDQEYKALLEQAMHAQRRRWSWIYSRGSSSDGHLAILLNN